MESKKHGKFLGLPRTRLGWWAVGISLLFVLLFVLVTNTAFHLPGMFIMGLGLVAAVLVLLAILWKRERSWLLWLMLLPGLFAIFFSAGEVLFPH
jgi:hypothetical protein